MQDVLNSAAIPTAAELTRLADVLDVGCLVVDDRLIIRGWNHWLEAASGRTASDVIGQPVFDVFPELADSSAARSLERALAGESIVLSHRFHEYFVKLPVPPGLHFEQMQQSARIVPYIEDGKTLGAVALIQDVSERVQRERDLQEARERAEAANKAKSEFLAAVSHELRTPLTAVLGYSDLLESEISGTLNEHQKDHLSRIVAGTWHLIKIIDEILSFSRVEAHKYEVALEKVNVNDLVAQTTALLDQQAAAKGIAFDVDLPSLPIIIVTDALKLRQILINVLGNAIKFTDVGGVSIAVQERDGYVHFVISDTGPGIPLRFHKLVFEPFVQVDQSTTRVKGGTGLGLPLSRSLAELLGGELTLEGSSDAGTTFRLRLPANPSD